MKQTSCFLTKLLSVCLLAVIAWCKGCFQTGPQQDGEGEPREPPAYDSAVTNNLREIAVRMGMDEAEAHGMPLDRLAGTIAKSLGRPELGEIKPLTDAEWAVVKKRLSTRPQYLSKIEKYRRFLAGIQGKHYFTLPCMDKFGSPIGPVSHDFLPPVSASIDSIMRGVARKFGVAVPATTDNNSHAPSRSLPFLYEILSKLVNTERWYGDLLSVEDMQEVSDWFYRYPDELERIRAMHSAIEELADKSLVLVQ